MTRSKNKKNEKPSLLIKKHKQEIINAVRDHKEVIIVGQTGCGKSTQVPQYLHQYRSHIGLREEDVIACLHPRAVAATSLAERVSEENHCYVGELVGHRVRFYSVYSATSRIVYMTAGFMTKLLTYPEEIERYGVVIIDEAHQRSVDNDIVMGQIKMIMKTNNRLRLVIMSATLNIEEMAHYYPEAPIVRVTSVPNNVDVIYRNVISNNYVSAIKDVIVELLNNKDDNGNILVFLPSEDKVWQCKNILKKATVKAKVMTFYGAMDHKDKMTVFQKCRGRKVIIATNIAETSLTIEGVKYVIDSGFVKRVRYDAVSRVEKWMTERVSAAESEQRRGRAGRTGKGRGTCYRLYDPYDGYVEKISSSDHLAKFLGNFEKKYELGELRIIGDNVDKFEDLTDWESVPEKVSELLKDNPVKKSWISFRYPVPDISIVNLDSTVLTMEWRRVEMSIFPFIVTPDPDKVKTAIKQLKDLSLLNDDDTITPLGSKVAQLPVSPALGKVAVLSHELCSREDIFIIIAMLSRPTLSKQSKCPINSPHGDLIKLLFVFTEAEMNGFSKKWCKDNGVIHSNINYCRLIYKQLCRLLYSPAFPWEQSTRDLFSFEERLPLIKKAFLSGFFNNLSIIVPPSIINNKEKEEKEEKKKEKNKDNKKKGDNKKKDEQIYQMVDGKSAVIFQNSSLSSKNNINNNQQQQQQQQALKIVLPIFVQNSSDTTDNVTLKECMAYSSDMLVNIDARRWRIRANLWRDVLNNLKVHR